MTKQLLKTFKPVAAVVLALSLVGCLSVKILAVSTSFTTPQQQLPRLGASQTNECKKVFYTWTIFRTNFDGSVGFPAYSPSNYITAFANGQTIPTTKYFVAARNIATGASRCVTNIVNGKLCFPGSPNEKDMFNVCFTDQTYGNQPVVSLLISPTP